MQNIHEEIIAAEGWYHNDDRDPVVAFILLPVVFLLKYIRFPWNIQSHP